MEKVLQVFSGTSLREAVTIYNHLKLHDLTMDDLTQYVIEIAREERGHRKAAEETVKRIEEEGRREWSKIAPSCPKCEASLFLKRICKKKGPENINGWTCLWYCENGDCTYEKYTHENAGEEMEKLKERGRKI